MRSTIQTLLLDKEGFDGLNLSNVIYWQPIEKIPLGLTMQEAVEQGKVAKGVCVTFIGDATMEMYGEQAERFRAVVTAHDDGYYPLQ